MKFFNSPTRIFVLYFLFVIWGAKMFTPGILQAQSDLVIQFESDASGRIKFKKENVVIPFGKKVFFEGVYNSPLVTLRIRTILSLREEMVDAEVNGMHWSALIGPYEPTQNLLFVFEITSRLTNVEKKHIQEQLKTTINNFVDGLLDEEDPYTEDSLRVWLNYALTPNFKQYKDRKGQTLSTILVEQMLSLGFDNILEKLNMIGDIEETKDRVALYFSFIKNSLILTEKFNLIQQNIRNEEKLKFTLNRIKANPEILKEDLNATAALLRAVESADSTILNKKNEFIGTLKRLETEINKHESQNRERNDFIGGLLEKMFPKIMKTQLNSAVSSPVNAQVSDIESYAGFDIAATVIPGASTVTPFFTVNPHLKKVDINRDPEKFLDYFCLSGGIGLRRGDIETDGPLYFVGLGTRLNRLFRFTGGRVFYKKKNKNDFHSEWAIIFSLNFRFISDLLTIVGGAKGSL